MNELNIQETDGSEKVRTRLIIDSDFKVLIPGLSPAEREGLEQDLLRDGCRDPLVVWEQREGADPILLDGHNRYEICRRYDLPFSIIRLDLPSRAAAMLWICKNQIHRRNLNETQRAMIGHQIATLKQGARTDLAPIGAMSQTQAAKMMNVGRRTTQRAAVVRELGTPKLIEATMAGVIPASIGELVANLPPDEQDQIGAACIESGDAQPARAAIRNIARKIKPATDTPEVPSPSAREPERRFVKSPELVVAEVKRISAELTNSVSELSWLPPGCVRRLADACRRGAERLNETAAHLEQMCEDSENPPLPVNPEPHDEVNLD
jgi:hypothetical protein